MLEQSSKGRTAEGYATAPELGKPVHVEKHRLIYLSLICDAFPLLSNAIASIAMDDALLMWRLIPRHAGALRPGIPSAEARLSVLPQRLPAVRPAR